jgi:osmotically-inducible protein OsmY
MRVQSLKTAMATAIIISMMLVAIVPVTAMAQSDKKTDQAIQTLLEKRLDEHGLMKNNDVTVTVKDGTIILSGTVATIADKMKVEKDAKKVGENYTIEDNLTLKTQNMTDQQLLDKVVEKVKRNVFYSIFDWVTIGVTNGVVTLNGWVYEPWHRSLFEHQVEKVVGVTKINNEIKILPVNLFDDQIRHRAAKLIYDNSDFEPYALVMNPPIHIIVNDGKVTLEGYVTSQYQRNMAEYLINLNTDALQITNNLQIVP